MAVVDPLFTAYQAAELRRWTADIYRELEKDGDFGALRSVMPDVYSDLAGWRVDSGHSYLYIPASVDRSKPVPVLVFFHGSGGNFKAYTWVLSRLAERLEMALVAPSCGAGRWGHVRAERVLDDAIHAVSEIVLVDRTRINVVGLSNGGLAVSQLLVQGTGQFRSFVFVSPVFDTELLGGNDHFAASGSRTVYVLTGREDDRIPLQYVTGQVSRMKRRGVDVQACILDEANHFLFFSHRAQMLQQLEHWLREK